MSSQNTLKNLNLVYSQFTNCQNCDLSKTRNNIVFGDGNPNSNIIILGEAPGSDEDNTGLPFVGRSGKLLRALLNQAGIDCQKDVYITNVVKCRPPQNRKPQLIELEQCNLILAQQMAIIKPKFIVLVGLTAVKAILKFEKPMSAIRGKIFYTQENIATMPIYHPSFLLRFSDVSKYRLDTIDDLKSLNQYLK